MSGGHQSLSEAAVPELCVSAFFLTGCGLAVWATGSATGFAVISLIPAWMAGGGAGAQEAHRAPHEARSPTADRPGGAADCDRTLVDGESARPTLRQSLIYAARSHGLFGRPEGRDGDHCGDAPGRLTDASLTIILADRSLPDVLAF